MPGLKRSKPSKGPPSSAGKRYPNKPNARHSRTQKDTTRPQQWLKGTPRPQQWLLLGVQCCRLQGFKPSKRLKCFKGPCHARCIYMWDHVLHHTPQVDCFDHILLYVDISLPLMTPHHKMINHQQGCQVANTATASPLRTWRSSS